MTSIKKWIPLQNPANCYTALKFSDCIEYLHATLIDNENNKHQLIVKCDAIRSYRITKKHAVSPDLLQEISNHQWSFFIMDNNQSEYFAWSMQRTGISDYLGIMHYIIVTRDEIIDVLTIAEPNIEIIDIH